jgi:predicted nuclease with RNAse H fold
MVLGIDLAGVETRPTGLCLLKGMQAETVLVYTDEEILEYARRHGPAVITIDAPLSLPPGRKTIEDRSGEHLRACDRELQRRKIRFFPITLGPMRTLTKRGMALKSELDGMGCPVLECYPGGAQDILGIPRKQKGLETLRQGYLDLGIQGIASGLSDHELDAVAGAYVALLYWEGKAELYGSLEEGAIVMPPSE